LIPLLYQTGYLTIEKIGRDGLRPHYFLNYPNEEVRHSFLTYITAAFVDKDQFDIQPEGLALRDALKAEDIPQFVKKFQSFLSDIPSRLHIGKEAYYHSLTYLMLRLVKQVATLSRRAIKQIKDKKYHEPYLGTEKRILLLGLGFLDKQLHGRVEEI